MNFGLEGYLGGTLYAAAIAILLYTAFRKPVWGLYLLVPLIPLQTLRYRLQAYPLGSSLVLLTLLAIGFGLWRQKRPIVGWTPFNVLLGFYTVFTLISLCAGSFYLNVSLPFLSWSDPRFAEWRDYMLMPLMLVLTASAVEDKKQIRILLLLMCLGAFVLNKSLWSTVSERDYSVYSDDLRDAGGMGYAGVNGLAAFEAQFAAFVVALASFEPRRLIRWSGYALAVFSAVCLMYSLSRAGYAALGAGWLFLGLIHRRWMLLALVVFGLTWTAIVPPAVRMRVEMTSSGNSLDHSSETRVDLWSDALRLFNESPVFGSGLNTYAYMHRIGDYRDTHNYFVKVLVETGLIGLALFLFLLARLIWCGLSLYWRSSDPLARSLGLGLAAWMACALAANFFGDRWSFLQVNGQLWILAGLMARAQALTEEQPAEAFEDFQAEVQPA